MVRNAETAAARKTFREAVERDDIALARAVMVDHPYLFVQ